MIVEADVADATMRTKKKKLLIASFIETANTFNFDEPFHPQRDVLSLCVENRMTISQSLLLRNLKGVQRSNVTIPAFLSKVITRFLHDIGEPTEALCFLWRNQKRLATCGSISLLFVGCAV
jgi:hypothetical protein